MEYDYDDTSTGRKEEKRNPGSLNELLPAERTRTRIHNT